MIESVEINPDPKRLIEGLRDTGYSFNTAVADLIDNSIAADAKNIVLQVDMDFRGNITLEIADDGIGMGKSDLLNAMRYGSPVRPNPRSLGKFGLGMKTASTAFCRKLSVITRNSENEINKATWDLDHVVNVGKWEILLSTPLDSEKKFLNSVTHSSGTLVKWEKVDRLLKEYSDPGGNYAQRALKKLITGLEEHISLVYQRFLDIEDKREPQKISIFLNSNVVNPWDPFCEKIDGPLQETTISVEDQTNNEIGKFNVRAFVLPRKEEFKSKEEAENAKISNDRQGFYIYRENRLIHHADWLGMYSDEPHFSLLRVEFSFDSRLDDAFQVDIKKSQIVLNSELYRWAKDEFLPPVRREAEQRYRSGQRKQIVDLSSGAHDSSNVNIANKEGQIDQAKITIIDEESNTVEVINPTGKTQIKLKIESSSINPNEIYVHPVDSIDDGLLWQPALVGGKQAVQINKGHIYYRKVYTPNILDTSVPVGTIQGMDALLWALSISELKTVNDNTRNYFNDLRYEVSRILRKLVENLPDPQEN